MSKKFVILGCVLLLGACSEGDRLTRIDFVNRLIFYPQDMQSVFDTSDYNCLYLFPETYVEDLIKGEYRFCGDEYSRYSIYYRDTVDRKFKVRKTITKHNVVVESSVYPKRYYTFEFNYEDNKWCLRIIRYRNALIKGGGIPIENHDN